MFVKQSRWNELLTALGFHEWSFGIRSDAYGSPDSVTTQLCESRKSCERLSSRLFELEREVQTLRASHADIRRDTRNECRSVGEMVEALASHFGLQARLHYNRWYYEKELKRK